MGLEKSNEEKIKEVVKRLDGEKDYYAIEWPLVSRDWTFDIYLKETLKYYMPWIVDPGKTTV